MSYYDEIVGCPHCGRKTYRKPVRPFGGRDPIVPNCPLEEDCEAPKKCHAKIGIGVATLGNDCHYDEGHVNKGVPHSYYGEYCRADFQCNKHKDCRDQ